VNHLPPETDDLTAVGNRPTHFQRRGSANTMSRGPFQQRTINRSAPTTWERAESFAGPRAVTMLLAASLLLNGCGKPAATSTGAVPPAKVTKIAQEEELNTVELSPEAEKRLGVTLGTVETGPVGRLRGFGAEIVLPPGATMIVSSPVAGKLEAPSAAAVPKVGMLVQKGQAVFQLIPMLSPERAVLTPAERVRFAEAKNAVATARIDAAGQVTQFDVQVDAAKINLDRAERLFKEQVGTARAVDDAKAQLNMAQKSLDAAQSRQRLLDKLQLDEEAGVQRPLEIESPHDGMLRSVSAAVGEVVTLGAPLFEVLDFDPVWVKVPVYVGEVERIASAEPARISRLGEPVGASTRTALTVSAPPTALALASAVDLYYELPNPKGEFRPGERVVAQLKLAGEETGISIPWSAVIHDINGGTWVYVRAAEHRFARRRVQVRYVLGDRAVLAEGLPQGTSVVAAGAVELFGTEFGFAK
jgi:cobalt-zinc-cadmium efflux system membrane fusion protein